MPIRANGGVIGPRNNPTAGSAKGRWSLPEQYKWKKDSAWPGQGITATGGTETTITGYKVHTFTTTGPFQITSGAGNVEYLVIAGGGGGGGQFYGGSGGGAGGYRTNVPGQTSGGNSSAEGVFPMTPGSWTVTVGGGGGQEAVGSNSVFSTITSDGGGAGVSGGSGNPGGSGSGSSYPGSGGMGTPGQGSAGGANVGFLSGGGGGALEVGNTDGSGYGGDGLSSNISGTATTRGGGGGGSWYLGTTAAPGGDGGGGNGAPNSAPATAGSANTGGGGGGGNYPTPYPGLPGGSGIVIVRYVG